MEDYQREEFKNMLNKLFKGKDAGDLLGMLAKAHGKMQEAEQAKQQVETACNILMMFTIAVKNNGLGKTMEDIREAVADFPKDHIESIGEKTIVKSWDSMCNCVRKLNGMVVDGQADVHDII